MKPVLIDVGAWVSPVILNTIKNVIARCKDAGHTDLTVFIPLDDYGPMIMDIQQQMADRGQPMYLPFTPVILGVPVAPAAVSEIQIKARPYGTHTEPVIYDAHGHEYGVG